MVRRNPPRKAKNVTTIRREIAKSTTKKRAPVDDSLDIHVRPNVSLVFPKETQVLFLDGVSFKTPSEDKLFHKKVFNDKGGSNGAVLLNWQGLKVQALKFFTAHGDGVYNVGQQALWIDSGSVFIVAKADYEKLVKAKKIIPESDDGNPTITFKGRITAYEDGYATGNDKKLIDTR